MSLENRNKKLYYFSLVSIILISGSALVFNENFAPALQATRDFIIRNASSLYVLTMSAVLFFVVYLGFFSKYRQVKLTADNAPPEYSRKTWFAMLFSGSLGLGLIFWVVTEPLNHFLEPLRAESMSLEARKFAMLKSFLHWGFHPWAAAALFAVTSALMQYRKQKTALLSDAFGDLFALSKKKKSRSALRANFIDASAIFAVFAAAAASAGFGVVQLAAGIDFLRSNSSESAPGALSNDFLYAAIILLLTAFVILLLKSNNIKAQSIIADINIYLCFLILFAVFALGPTRKIIRNLLESCGLYFQNFIAESFKTGAYSNSRWHADWTLFYWSWSIAWAPFTGSYIASISKGRSIREIVAGVLIFPVILSFLFFSCFASLVFDCPAELLKEASASDNAAYFMVLNQLPGGKVLNLVTLVLIAGFFISSLISAARVLALLTGGAKGEFKTRELITRAATLSLLTAALVIGKQNALSMIQNISTIATFPFTFITLLLIPALLKSLKSLSKK